MILSIIKHTRAHLPSLHLVPQPLKIPLSNTSKTILPTTTMQSTELGIIIFGSIVGGIAILVGLYYLIKFIRDCVKYEW
ncbi:hypothetical protein EX30DRAFT_342301 [Ascodesmis nigricans]|uniref:Uncharacterized protein n=1 Tax=Ascodesmis nigricans TaxID=341454 RepID=A0A4S2MT71_9PEZI|nr:hypothetical protein EX30DRAFT_342301 [Ascodesmis nigricans]